MVSEVNIENTVSQNLLSSESNEWYTPPDHIELVRQVLGVIHLDPCSNQYAQEWIQAVDWYGLDHPDVSHRDSSSITFEAETVFMNSPYGVKNREKRNYGADFWNTKVTDCYRRGLIGEAIILCRGDGQSMNWLYRNAVCCIPDKRIKFVSPTGVGSRPKPGSRYFYLGLNPDKFAATFSKIGAVQKPYASYMDLLRFRDQTDITEFCDE